MSPPNTRDTYTGASFEVSRTPDPDWNDVTGASTYTLEYADNRAFTSPVETTGLTVSEFMFPSNLTDDMYYWRVRGQNASQRRTARFPRHPDPPI